MSAPNRCRAHVCVRVARRVQLGGGVRGRRWRCGGHVVVVSEAGIPAGASGGEGGGRLVEDGKGGKFGAQPWSRPLRWRRHYFLKRDENS